MLNAERARGDWPVERANGTNRCEFYAHYSGPLNLAAVNRALKSCQNSYNDYRPHQSLDLMTPDEHLASFKAVA